jgi:hypothetical protein
LATRKFSFDRTLVVGDVPEPGTLLAACDRIDVVYPETSQTGGRSMLKIFPKPDSLMGGELWKLAVMGVEYELWYNKTFQYLPRLSKANTRMFWGRSFPEQFAKSWRERICGVN